MSVRKSDKVEVVGSFQSFRFVNGRAGTLGLLGGSSFYASEPVFVERRLFRELSQVWIYIILVDFRHRLCGFIYHHAGI